MWRRWAQEQGHSSVTPPVASESPHSRPTRLDGQLVLPQPRTQASVVKKVPGSSGDSDLSEVGGGETPLLEALIPILQPLPVWGNFWKVRIVEQHHGLKTRDLPSRAPPSSDGTTRMDEGPQDRAHLLLPLSLSTVTFLPTHSPSVTLYPSPAHHAHLPAI